MSNTLFTIPTAAIPVAGEDDLFPVHRIYCVGRNYAEHTREMGGDPTREKPFFFTKPYDAVITGDKDIPVPTQTKDLHHEVELVVALKSGGKNLTKEEAIKAIYGYAVGVDLTCRDLQAKAKAKSRPWCAAKAFDQSAPIGKITPAEKWQNLQDGQITITVNGAVKQTSPLANMIWPVPEILTELSTYFTLAPGDLIFTGTPAGVGRLVEGDSLIAEITGLDPLRAKVISS